MGFCALLEVILYFSCGVVVAAGWPKSMDKCSPWFAGYCLGFVLSCVLFGGRRGLRVSGFRLLGS